MATKAIPSRKYNYVITDIDLPVTTLGHNKYPYPDMPCDMVVKGTPKLVPL